jgi:hypothetical protein
MVAGSWPLAAGSYRGLPFYVLKKAVFYFM